LPTVKQNPETKTTYQAMKTDQLASSVSESGQVGICRADYGGKLLATGINEVAEVGACQV